MQKRVQIPRVIEHTRLIEVLENHINELHKRIDSLESEDVKTNAVWGIRCTCNADYTGMPHDKFCPIYIVGRK